MNTSASIMQAWREATRLGEAQPAPHGLARDVTRYLGTVSHMPTYRERAFHLLQWITVFGYDRARHTITTTEINAALSTWARTLSPTTVRHYRTALLHLYHRLDGCSAPNPVRASWRPADPPPQPRSIPPATVAKILQTVTGPKTRARLWVMATTGLPHKQVMQLTPEAIDWSAQRARIPARAKGRGAAGRWLPLSPAALAALRAFNRADAWGTFSPSSMRRAWQRALVTLKLPTTLRPYDLRHAMGTMLYAQTGDLATVARLLGHADQRTASRYSLSAHDGADAKAMAKVGIQLPSQLEKRKRRR